MDMTRKSAILACFSLLAAKRVYSQDSEKRLVPKNDLQWSNTLPKPMSLQVTLGGQLGIDRLVVKHGSDEIVISADEIWEALRQR